MAYPTNYRYTREHEWISLDGKIGTVGITDYAQNSLGDIVYVDVPKVGDSITANASFGSVESVKAVSDLYSPVTGTVTAVNEELKTSPDKINEAPHEAWIIKVELSDPSQFEKLLDAASYEKFFVGPAFAVKRVKAKDRSSAQRWKARLASWPSRYSPIGMQRD